VVESLIGALLLDSGLAPAEAFIRRAWAAYVDGQARPPQHPKSVLQELTAARGLPNPAYDVVRQSGAHHAPCFKVRVSLRTGEEAEAEGTSKQEAETAAALALLSTLSHPARGKGSRGASVK
jgi:ribonuclease-3